jgi:protein PhnA
MNIETTLIERSGSACELCGNKDDLVVYGVLPATPGGDQNILICGHCAQQIDGIKPMDANHWRCLTNSMWSTIPAVQVMAWRLLNTLRHEGWPQDLLDILYLDEGILAWAKNLPSKDDIKREEIVIHKDSNGTQLQQGDTVILIKDLDVKGAGFTAKRGTAVRGISLVEHNKDQIEGRVEGQQIVILTQFVKKSG